MFKIAFLLSFVPALAFASFHTCKKGYYPNTIHVNICQLNDNKCVIQVGQTIKFDMEFVARVSAETVTPYIEATKWFMSRPLKIAETDQIACNTITTLDGKPGCPLVAGEKYKYHMEFPVHMLPITGFDVYVSFLLKGNRGDLSCFEFDASLRS